VLQKKIFRRLMYSITPIVLEQVKSIPDLKKLTLGALC